MSDVMNGTYFKGEDAIEFNFYTNLTYSQKLGFVNSVTDIIVDGENYNYIIRDLVFDFFIIDTFTNFDTSYVYEDDFLGNAEQLLKETNIVDVVKANMEIGLLDELNKAIDLNVEYKTGIHPNVISDALSNLIKTLDNKVKDFDVDSMMDMAKLFTGMTDEFTPESIMNAYMASDVHKNNVIEIEEAKKQNADFAEDMDKAIKETDGSKKSKSKSKPKK